MDAYFSRFCLFLAIQFETDGRMKRVSSNSVLGFGVATVHWTEILEWAGLMMAGVWGSARSPMGCGAKIHGFAFAVDFLPPQGASCSSSGPTGYTDYPTPSA
jgi:hypothetical protein